MNDHANGKAGSPEMTQERQHQIVEPLIIVGRCEDGKVRHAFVNCTPGAAAIILQQQLNVIIAGFTFDRQSNIIGVVGTLPKDIDMTAGRR